MALSDRDSENLQRIADALDPPPDNYNPGPAPPSWPMPLRALAGGIVAALMIAIPAGLVMDLVSKDVGNAIFLAAVAFGVWLGASVD